MKFITFQQIKNIINPITSKLSKLSTVATTGSYNDLKDKPAIPTKATDLINDAEYLTLSTLPTYSGGVRDVN